MIKRKLRGNSFLQNDILEDALEKGTMKIVLFI